MDGGLGPRRNPKPVKAIELLGLDLHDRTQHETKVENSEVEVMQNNLAEHTDETNEIFNLMARQIKKRAEERVNLVEVTDAKRKENSLMRSVEQLDT